MRQYFGLPIDGNRVAGTADNACRLETLAGDSNGFEDVEAKTDDSWVIPAEILSQRTKAPPEQIKIFSVQENLMEPEYRLGENILIDLSDNVPSPPGTFIVSDGFGIMLRFCEYVPNSNPPEIKVSALSDSFQSQTLQAYDFKVIGRVIAKLQWL